MVMVESVNVYEHIDESGDFYVVTEPLQLQPEQYPTPSQDLNLSVVFYIDNYRNGDWLVRIRLGDIILQQSEPSPLLKGGIRVHNDVTHLKAVHNVIFPFAGLYEFDILLDGVVISTTPLQLI